jgi:hypothetical protein
MVKLMKDIIGIAKRPYLKVGQATAYAKEVGRRCKKDVPLANIQPAMKLVPVIRKN